jgi:hypothetical protein
VDPERRGPLDRIGHVHRSRRARTSNSPDVPMGSEGGGDTAEEK